MNKMASITSWRFLVTSGALMACCFGIFVQGTMAMVNPSSVTMSGFSSGGAMAMQFHLSHSALLNGVGIFGGLPYACGLYSNSTHCHHVPDESYMEEIYRQAEQQNIDSLDNLIGSKVFVFHGALDSGIIPALGTKIIDIYGRLQANVTAVLEVQAEHGFPTTSLGSPCPLNSFATHYISNCSYNGAFHVLNNLYGGSLEDPTGGSIELDGLFSSFTQIPYLPVDVTNPESISLDQFGYLYIPSGCLGNVTLCKLHLALHGCRQSRGLIGNRFARESGYMEVGELNNILIIFPQATPTLDNPNGCWNWWGYLPGAEYLNKQSPQIQTLYNLIQEFLEFHTQKNDELNFRFKFLSFIFFYFPKTSLGLHKQV